MEGASISSNMCNSYSVCRDCAAMEVIRNNRDGLKLSLNGFMYVKKATKTNRIRWQCSMRRSSSFASIDGRGKYIVMLDKRFSLV